MNADKSRFSQIKPLICVHQREPKPLLKNNMKNLFFLFFLLSQSLFSQNRKDSLTIHSQIAKVRLFVLGAEITRNADVTLIAGEHEYTFVDLTRLIFPNTIHIQEENGFNILSIAQSIDLHTRKSLLKVRILAKKTQATTLQFSYFVPNAAWLPLYDFEVKDIDTPLNVRFSARVFQNSGEDWENVALTLVYVNPYGIHNCNKLSDINDYVPEPYRFMEKMNESANLDNILDVFHENARSPFIGCAGGCIEDADYDGVTDLLDDDPFVVEGDVRYRPGSILFPPQTTYLPIDTMAEFVYQFPTPHTLLSKFTIPNQIDASTFPIKTFEIPVQYQYFATPTLDKNVPSLYDAAFLFAYFPYSYEWLPGEASMTFDGITCYPFPIDTTNIQNKKYLFVSYDKNVKVLIIKDKKNKKVKISLENGKKQAIDVLTEMYFPRYSHQNIRVKKADKNIYSSEKIQWQVKIETGEKKVLRFKRKK